MGEVFEEILGTKSFRPLGFVLGPLFGPLMGWLFGLWASAAGFCCWVLAAPVMTCHQNPKRKKEKKTIDGCSCCSQLCWWDLCSVLGASRGVSLGGLTFNVTALLVLCAPVPSSLEFRESLGLGPPMYYWPEVLLPLVGVWLMGTWGIFWGN